MIDRTGWPRGEWDSEPDEDAWTDEATGLACRAARSIYSGAWHGYVRVPEGHPLHGAGVGDGRLNDLDVHGSVWHVGPIFDEGWWLGFDCAHDGDLQPGREHSHHGMYCSLAYVKAQCAKLARQVMEVVK